jgi:hypothetical protein|tara:strand:- start:9 stop:719 length:711 start_codon:yes stop_codon:yes gene_type:complete
MRSKEWESRLGTLLSEMKDRGKLKADRETLAYIGAKPRVSSDTRVRDSGAWFTPSLYTEMAKEVMGEIDLDPFSSAAANSHVCAKRYFDEESDAFKQTWFQDPGRVFMNPPYGRKIVDASTDLFLANWSNGSVAQGIVLVNNATETRWFQSLLRTTTLLCLPERRIAFENDDGKHVSGNTRGQAFFYFGDERQRFEEVFGRIGIVLAPGPFFRKKFSKSLQHCWAKTFAKLPQKQP